MVVYSLVIIYRDVLILGIVSREYSDKEGDKHR